MKILASAACLAAAAIIAAAAPATTLTVPIDGGSVTIPGSMQLGNPGFNPGIAGVDLGRQIQIPVPPAENACARVLVPRGFRCVEDGRGGFRIVPDFVWDAPHIWKPDFDPRAELPGVRIQGLDG